MRILTLIAAALAAIAMPATAQADPAPITGDWRTKDERAIIRVARCGDSYCGRIQRFLVPEPAGGAYDTRNPRRNLRSRHLLGIAVFWNLRPDGGDWEGNGYSPEDGRYFTAQLRRLPSGQLEVKGCVIVFCRTQVWERAR